MDAGADALHDNVVGFGDNLLPFDGGLYLIRQFYAPPESDRLFAALMTGMAWQAEDIFIFGRWVKVPRLMCWYGDADAHYRYSGVDHVSDGNRAEIAEQIGKFGGGVFVGDDGDLMPGHKKIGLV